MKTIWVTFKREGIHKYPAALEDPKLDDVKFLGYPHRHMFHFKVNPFSSMYIWCKLILFVKSSVRFTFKSHMFDLFYNILFFALISLLVFLVNLTNIFQVVIFQPKDTSKMPEQFQCRFCTESYNEVLGFLDHFE